MGQKMEGAYSITDLSSI